MANYSIKDYYWVKVNTEGEKALELFCKMTSPDWETEMPVLKYTPVSEDETKMWEEFNNEVYQTLGFLPEYDIK